MVLNEIPSEKVQRIWYSRLAQERRELSASVEEALINVPLEDGFWLDDQSQSATAVRTHAGKANNVIPPRLSLRSRSVSETPSSMAPRPINTQNNMTQQANLWTRLIHRLTSPFSALRSSSSIPATPVPPPANETVSTEPAQMENVVRPEEDDTESGHGRMLATATHFTSIKSEGHVATGTDIRPGSSWNIQGRQRLAGRTTRIRLEVVPTPFPSAGTYTNKSGVSVRLPAVERAIRRSGEDPIADGNGGVTSVRLPAVEKGARRFAEGRTCADGDGGVTSVRLPTVEKEARRLAEGHTCTDGDGGVTSVRLPAVERGTRRREEHSLVWHAGSGMFECGQRDVTISDPSVTASSVVLVMLTANPGPVVVQYVSLQPKVGFTVHLTAPTTMGAPFNYVVSK